MDSIKRRGVIAALLSFGGFLQAFAQRPRIAVSHPDKTTTWMMLNLPEAVDDPLHPISGNCKTHTSETDSALSIQICDAPPKLKVDVMLEVRYKGRVVKLTGDEIMDALEGKSIGAPAREVGK